MYLNKNELTAVRVLTLRMKVHAKKAAAARATTGEFDGSWDIAEYSHMAILSIIDPDKRERAYNRTELVEHARHNEHAKDALFALRHYLRV